MLVYLYTHRGYHCELWVEFFTFPLVHYQQPELLKMFLKLAKETLVVISWLGMLCFLT